LRHRNHPKRRVRRDNLMKHSGKGKCVERRFRKDGNNLSKKKTEEMIKGPLGTIKALRSWPKVEPRKKTACKYLNRN